MRPLVIATILLGCAQSAMAQRTCVPDSATRLSILARKPGAILSTTSDPIATFTSETNGTNARLETRVLTDAESHERAAGVAVFIAGSARGPFRTVFVDESELPRFLKALTVFEAARVGGQLPTTERQEFTTRGGVHLTTFWDGKQRVVSLTSEAPCGEVSAYLDAPTLGSLRDAIADAQRRLGAGAGAR